MFSNHFRKVNIIIFKRIIDLAVRRMKLKESRGWVSGKICLIMWKGGRGESIFTIIYCSETIFPSYCMKIFVNSFDISGGREYKRYKLLENLHTQIVIFVHTSVNHKVAYLLVYCTVLHYTAPNKHNKQNQTV